MKEKRISYILDAEAELVSLLSGLPEKYSLQHDRSAIDSVCYLDTFDWRLFNQGLIFLRQGNNVYILTDFTGGERVQADGPVLNKLFSHDFTSELLGEKLRSIAGIRALLPLVKLSRQSHSFQIVNRDQKGVLSGFLELNQLLRPDGQSVALGGSLQIQGVRGYDKILAKVTDLLRSRGLESGDAEERVLRQALAIQGRKPLDYSSHLAITLDPSEPVVLAAQKIFLQTLEGMERNVFGITEDIDPEFLHDFRVALRRTRSLLGTMKKILPLADVGHFQREFQKIGIFTGPVRDLDVYLLERNIYQSFLPDELQEGLSLFFQELTRQQVKELQRMKRALQSKRFQQVLEQWRRYVEESLISSAFAAGHVPCKEVAARAVKKRLRSILKEGAQIGPQSPDSTLHSLRVQAKKMRYLLEFYRSLFPEQGIDSLIKSLKKLQDNLGKFNDLSVQQRMLGQYQKGLAGRERKEVNQMAAALGALVTHLHEEQGRVRQKFEQTFEQFAAIKNKDLHCFLS